MYAPLVMFYKFTKTFRYDFHEFLPIQKFSSETPPPTKKNNIHIFSIIFIHIC